MTVKFQDVLREWGARKLEGECEGSSLNQWQPVMRETVNVAFSDGNTLVTALRAGSPHECSLNVTEPYDDCITEILAIADEVAFSAPVS